MQTSIQNRPAGVAASGTKAGRMSLGTVTRGKIAAPIRILLYGTEGIGKSTWAAGAPAPIVIPVEEGTNHLDVARFPRPETLDEVFDAVRSLKTEPHEFKTVVIDTFDALEQLVWAHVAKVNGKKDIEEFGYGKGYVLALNEWLRLYAELEALRRERGMSIISLAHSQIRTTKNPLGADFDRFTLKLQERAAGLAKEWHDVVVFARFEEFADKSDGRRAKGVSTGARAIHTQRTAAWDAKNRFDLPETLPLSYEDFARSVAARQPADPAKLRAEITTLAAQLDGAPLEIFHREKFEQRLKAAGNDAAELAKVRDVLTAKLAQKEA